MTGGADVTLVTGGAGFLGQQVIRALVGLGRRVRALVRPGSDPNPIVSLADSAGHARIEVVQASFNDRDALGRALEGVQVVLHIAASKKGAAAAQVANTVIGSDNLFEAALVAGVSRLVLVSSLGIMGTADLRTGADVDERVPLEPHPERRDPYTFAKHRQEQLAWTFHRDRGLPLVVIRPGVIFGPGQSMLSSRVGLPLAGLFLHLGGSNRVPLTFVDNCADAIVKAGSLELDVVGEAFNIVDDSLPTSRAILKRYRRDVKRLPFVPVPRTALRLLARLNQEYALRTEGHIPPVFTPYKVDAIWKRQTFSNAKAKARLGWTPRVPMHEALDLTFADESRRARSAPH